METPGTTPKYDTEVDVSNENMSQTLLALLVGEGKSVLDVGCATGYTASVLRARGCRVDGIEHDASVADEAAKHVDRLEVGDVQAMDLVGLFGAASYDAIVFGDVLEHLTQPEAVLRACLPLLKRGGAVVASIPNVAHGAVRLALLKGRFAYTSTGLLDETHVRFFTRDSVLGLFEAAGYAVVDLRRTRLGVFETEVRVAEGDYPPAVVAEVAADPEAETYQFVCRAVPAAEADPAAVQAVADAEALRVPAQVQAVDTAAPTVLPVVPSARLGLWGSWDVDDVSQAVLGRVLSVELPRRLPGVLLRFAAPHGAALRTGLGEPVEELGPIGALRSKALGAGLDAALVVGPVDTDEAVLAARHARAVRQDDPTKHLLHGPSDVPVLWGPVTLDGSSWVSLAPGSAPGGPTRPLPDPGVLASRVQSAAAAHRRTAYLRSAGWLALSPRVVVVHLSGDTDVAPVVAQLRALVEADRGLSVCALELDTTKGDAAAANAVAGALSGKALVCPVDAGVDSHLALLAVADLVISTSSTARAAAASYGVPALDPSDLSAAASLLAETDRHRAPGPDVVADQAALDAWFEEVAERVRKAVAPADERAVLSSTERYEAMERAHAAMRARTSTEVLRAAEAAPELVSFDAGPEIDRLRAEIHALNNTRTMRALKPARDLYARVRARAR